MGRVKPRARASTNKLPLLKWTFENVQKGEADLYVYDVIGDPFFGTTAADFVQELRSLDVARLNVYIKSEGGYVDDGLEIYNALLNHKAEVTVSIGALCASIATVVAMAGNKVVIARNAKMVIHDAMALGLGNAANFREIADQLDEESANIADIYAQRTTDDAAAWRSRMQANNGDGSIYRGEQAIAVGLADELMANKASNLAFDRIAALSLKEIAEAEIVDEDDDDETIDIPIDLIAPMANGYKPPLPADFTRLVMANMPNSKEPRNANGN